MASPQVENGYTRIANELLEAVLSADFSKREHVIVLAIIRKTYGYNKKMDVITLSQFSKLTGFDRGNVSKALASLSEKGVLLKRQHGDTQLIGISKNYSEWKIKNRGCQNDKGCQNDNKGLSKRQQKGCQNDNAGVVKMTTTKDNTTKDNKKDNLKTGGAVAPIHNLNIAAWNEYEQYRREAKIRKLQPRSVAKQQKWLSQQGDLAHQQAIVDYAIRNGNQGLFPLRGKQQAVQDTRDAFTRALEN